MRNQQQSRELQQLLNKYIPLNYDSIAQHGVKLPPKTTTNFFKSATNFRSTGFSSPPSTGTSISHKSLLYPSLEISKTVLNANRKAYKEMMRAMSQFEFKEHQDYYSAVQTAKNQANYTRIHCKKHRNRECSLINE